MKDSLELDDIYFFPNVTFSLRLQHPSLESILLKVNFKMHIAVLKLWNILLLKSISFFPGIIKENMFWRGSQMNPERHCFGESFEHWQSAYPDFEPWICRQQPNLYFRKQNVNFFDKVIHFLPEKKAEIQLKRFIFRTHIFNLLRILFSLLNGLFPKELFIPWLIFKRYYISFKHKLTKI